jgi:uncharacterized Zn-binding protein involved in type VI secretion
MGLPAARLTDMHVCPLVTVLVPHVGGPIISPGCPTVLIGGSLQHGSPTSRYASARPT